MNIQSLVVVALRLLALDFLLRVAVQLTPQMLQLLKMDEQLGVAGDSRYRTTAWMALLALVVGAALLWFLAVPIARLVTRNVSQELSLGSLTLADCYSVVFIGIGLLYMVRCLPKVLSLANYFLTTPASERRRGAQWCKRLRGLGIYYPIRCRSASFRYGPPMGFGVSE
jgi:hypothetical protein